MRTFLTVVAAAGLVASGVGSAVFIATKADAQVPAALVGTWITDSDSSPAGPGGVSEYRFDADGTYVLQMVNNNSGGGAALAGRYSVEGNTLHATIDRCAPYACGPNIPRVTSDTIGTRGPGTLVIGTVTYAREN
ncbi:hypothetical protein [Nocardia sp. alder85J]|uniref:hypothetical protein n=1 Tax=Nocardia sp. alder85J TaxID=2862949 RepID=UPI001CD5F979|nr:hypothetical protein [Nocardia sp. alder85J]MCX4090930.1 hypothetical protein [Nocardia sp. alder85J]